MPSFLRNKWYGGFSDDAYVGGEATFQDGFGCEIRNKPGVLQLANKVTAATGTLAAKINKILFSPQAPYYCYCFADDGKVYGLRSADNVLVEVYDLVADGSTADGNPGIKNAILYGAHIYFASGGKLHRSSTVGIFASVDVDRKTLGSEFKAMVKFKGNLYLSNGSKLAEYNGTTRTASKVAVQSNVKNLQVIGNHLYIYSGTGTGNSDFGHIETRDGVAGVDNYLNRGPENLIGAAADGSMQYILGGHIQSDGFKARIFKASGFQKSKGIEINDKPTTNPNAIRFIEDIFTFGVDGGIMTYGKLDSKYPDSLVYQWKTSNGAATDEILSIEYADSAGGAFTDRILFSWVNAAGTSYGVDYIDVSKYESTGEVISKFMDSQDRFQVKELQAVKLAFSKLAAGESINVYLRQDGDTARGSAVLTADYSDTDDQDVVYKTAYGVARNFNRIEAKIELNSGTSDATTPEVQGLQLDRGFIQVDSREG